MSNIKDIVENKHRVHKQYCNYWNFLLESWEGGVDYSLSYVISSNNHFGQIVDSLFQIFAGGKQITNVTRSNLFQHPKERAQDYKDRVQMSYYYNFCSPIIDIYTDHLFKQTIIEDFGNIQNIVELRKENIDRKNGSILEFRKELTEMAQVYGHVFVLCDTPNIDKNLLTFQDVIDNDVFPYFTIFSPQSIINWALDSFGNPYWVLVIESEDANSNPFNMNTDKPSNYYYRLWTRQEWILYDGEYKEIGRGLHNLGFVPITCVFDKQSKKVRNFLGVSAIADIAFIARDIYNSCSELKQILRDQTFAFLALQGESSEYDELSIGTGKGLLYPVDRNPPQYISPPSINAEVYFKHIDRQVTKIFQLAKLEGGSADFQGQTAVNQSGVSKAWDFNQTNSALSKKATNIENGEMKLWQMFAAWQGLEFDGSIVYPNEFSIQSLKQDLDEAEQAARVQLGKTFNIEVKKAIIKKKFPRLPDTELEKMMKEIEINEGKGESGRLIDRLPSLAERFMNANSSGKKEEQNV